MNKTLLITMMLLIGGSLSAAGTVLSPTLGIGTLGISLSGGLLLGGGMYCAFRELR